MEEQLLVLGAAGAGKKGEDESLVLSEVKKQLRLAGPLVVDCLLQNVVQMISVMFVGHLGELALSSASMATSFANVTGFSLLVGRHGVQPGHAVRAGLRRQLALHAGRVQAAGDAGAVPHQRARGGALGVHGPDPAPPWPGPGDRGGCRQLHPVDDPRGAGVRAAAVPRPVPADAEHRGARDAQLRRHRAEPPAGVLGAGARARHGEQGRRPRQRRLLLHQPLHPRALRPALAVLHEDLDGLLGRRLPRPPGVPQARRAVRPHGLHGVVVVRAAGAALRSTPKPQAGDGGPVHLLEHQLPGVHGAARTRRCHKHAPVERARSGVAGGGAAGGARRDAAGGGGGRVGGASDAAGAQRVGVRVQQRGGGGRLRRPDDAHPRHVRRVRRPPVRPLRRREGLRAAEDGRIRQPRGVLPRRHSRGLLLRLRVPPWRNGALVRDMVWAGGADAVAPRHFRVRDRLGQRGDEGKGQSLHFFAASRHDDNVRSSATFMSLRGDAHGTKFIGKT